MKPYAYLMVAAALCTSLSFAGDVKDALATRLTPKGNYFAQNNVFTRVTKLDVAADLSWDDMSDEAIRKRGDQMRAKFLEAIGGLPEATPLNAKIVETVKKDGYKIEKLIFESRPKHFVTGYVFVPDCDKYKPPYPAIIVPCGHTDIGSKGATYQRGGVVGAKHGFVTLVFDPIEQGERRQIKPVANISPTHGHNYLGVRAFLIGQGTARYRLHDGVRAIDYLCSRKDVDADKIGCMGNSGGGTMTALISAYDKRVKCSAPSGFLSTMEHVMRYEGTQDAEQFIYGQMTYGMNHLGMVMMRYPNPTLIVSPYDDFFPWEGAYQTAAKLKQIWGKHGIGDRIDLAETHGPHGWYEATMQASARWMRKWFYGDENAWPVSEADLMNTDLHDSYGVSLDRLDCGVAVDRKKGKLDKITPTGFVGDLEGSRMALDDVWDMCREVEKARKPLTKDAVRVAAKIRKLNDIDGTVINEEEKKFKTFTLKTAVVSRKGGIFLPVWSFVPNGDVKGAVLLVSDTPNNMNYEKFVEEELVKGRAVHVAQLRGFAHDNQSKRIRRFYEVRGFVTHEDEDFATMGVMLGESYPSMRAEDMLAVTKYLNGKFGSKVDVLASGRAVIPAVHATYLEDQLYGNVTLQDKPVSWKAMIDDWAYPMRFASVIHGAYLTYDWVDLVK